jgi:AraC-like DNA-binding protein
MNKVMQAKQITSCYIGPHISPENFVAEHFFLHLAKGVMNGYDGHKDYTLNAGEFCLVRKNHLARYNKQKENDEFEKVIIILDEPFLKQFQQKHKVKTVGAAGNDAFIRIKKNELIGNFLQSLKLYYNKQGAISNSFADLKREELLLILLQVQPELAHILFDFGIPQTIDLESFMNRNFRFNVAIQRFAFLTGRSLTRFKYDFKKVFNDTPSRWLIRKRLEEAYFLMDKKGRRASEVYLEVGFEDLSHFSFAFKKSFGFSPRELAERDHMKDRTSRA